MGRLCVLFWKWWKAISNFWRGMIWSDSCTVRIILAFPLAKTAEVQSRNQETMTMADHWNNTHERCPWLGPQEIMSGWVLKHLKGTVGFANVSEIERREGGAKHDCKVFLLSNSKIWKFIYWDGLKKVRSPDSHVVIVRCLLEVQVPESNKQLENVNIGTEDTNLELLSYS